MLINQRFRNVSVRRAHLCTNHPFFVLHWNNPADNHDDFEIILTEGEANDLTQALNQALDLHLQPPHDLPITPTNKKGNRKTDGHNHRTA